MFGVGGRGLIVTLSLDNTQPHVLAPTGDLDGNTLDIALNAPLLLMLDITSFNNLYPLETSGGYLWTLHLLCTLCKHLKLNFALLVYGYYLYPLETFGGYI